MHTLEVDICILKTCLEVIICRPTITILLSKVKNKMYADMYFIVHNPNNKLVLSCYMSDTLINRMHFIPCESGAGVMSIQCL